MTKYTISQNDHVTEAGMELSRIHRLFDGQAGGYVQSEQNLSQEGTCFIHYDSRVFELARIEDDAQVYGRVFGQACVGGQATVIGEVSGNARVSGSAVVIGRVYGNAIVEGNAKVIGEVYGTAHVSGNEVVFGSRSS